MSDTVLVAIITSVVTVLGVILSNSKSTAVIENEIKHLAAEVAKHNNFARRMPVLEEQINALSKRIEALERKSG